jgi:hypothetical protein
VTQLPRRWPADSDRPVYSPASRTAGKAFGSSCPDSATYEDTACMAAVFGSNNPATLIGSGMGCKGEVFDSSCRGSSMERRHIACISASGPRSRNKTRRRSFAQGTAEATVPDNRRIDAWRLPKHSSVRFAATTVTRNQGWSAGGGNGACWGWGGAGDGRRSTGATACIAASFRRTCQPPPNAR